MDFPIFKFKQGLAESIPTNYKKDSVYITTDTKRFYLDTTDTSAGRIQLNAYGAEKLLTARTINGVSFDGTANISINNLRGSASSSVVPVAASTAGELIYHYNVNNSLTGNMPTTNNANGIITLNTHSGNYTWQLGFSSDGNMYYRRGLGSAITADTAWYKIVSSDNYAGVLDGRYVNISGDTMTGLLTLAAGNHLGVKIGNTYLTAINGELILQNNSAIRFGSDSWDYNVWAGLKYVPGSKALYLGLADKSIFTANSAQTGGSLTLVNTHLYTNTNNTYDIGSSSTLWRNAYIQNRIFLKRQGNNTSYISFYSPAFVTWMLYMSTAGEANTAPNGSTPSTYGNVTTWALRSLIENSSGYGWVWESASNSASSTITPMMALSSSDGQLTVKGRITAPGASLGGYSNTSYALSAASAVINDWIRTNNATGWYNQTYGGGIYMTDSTYVRVYNSKHFLIGNNLYIGTTGGAGTGISLHGTSAPTTYGIHMSTTGNYGTHGDVQGDWATYFAMNAVGQRGWIYRAGSTNVASISANGVGTFNAVGKPTGYLSFIQNQYNYTGGNKTGYIKITLPALSTTTMMQFTVNIYNYVTNTSVKYIISGYKYNSGSWWYNVGAVCLGRAKEALSNLTVRFCASSATTHVVTIGEVDTTWSYPVVTISDVTIGHSNTEISNWNDGWGITIDTTAFANVQHTISNTHIGYNSHAESAGNADTVDGQHFSWSNSSNSPTYLWAANASGTAFLCHRASMSVNYANSAGAVAWDNITGKPSTYTPSAHSHAYLPLSGGTLSDGAQISRAGQSVSWIYGRSGAMIRQTSYTGYNPIWSAKTTNGDWSCGPCSNDVLYWNYCTDANFSAGTNTKTATMYLTSAGYLYTTRTYGAVWNDYAEYRASICNEPGRCVVEAGGKLIESTERLQPGANIVSDTFGFSIGETDECKTPLAVSGRVLAYPNENRYDYPLGAAVCSGPNGTISLMTREEIMMYPERIVGTVSEIPEYETWGTGNVAVNGRIWVKVK